MPIIIAVALLCLFVWGMPKLEELIKSNRKCNNVKWCINTSIDNLRVVLYRKKDIVDTKYTIADDDAKNINVIISSFKKYIKDEYFENKYNYTQKRVADTEVYYLLKLREYMIKNQYEMAIENLEIYKHEESVNNGGLWHNRFIVTEFGISYHKLLCVLHSWYIAYKKIDNQHSADVADLNNIKGVIDKGYIVTH